MSSNQNEIFFSLVYLSLSENIAADYVFKTGLLFATGLSDELKANPIKRKEQIPNIFAYLNEAKPYHTYFNGLLEQYTSQDDQMNVSIEEIIEPTIELHFDRVSCLYEDLGGFDSAAFDDEFDHEGTPTFRLGFDDILPALQLDREKLYNAANRITLFYRPRQGQERLDLMKLMDCEFKGLNVIGGNMNVDDHGYEIPQFDIFDYDGPIFDAQYYISDTPLLVTTFVEDTSDTSRKEFKPSGTTTFALPYTPFDTKKMKVYLDVSGNRTLVNNWTKVGNDIVFDTAPALDTIVIITVLDYDYIYDKIYTNEDNWGILNNEVILDGDGYIRPHFDKYHPAELIPVRILEGLNIEVYTDQSNVLNFVAGYDVYPYDLFPYDEGENTTGGGPQAAFQSYFDTEVNGRVIEVSQFPQSNEAILIFRNGVLDDQTTDYTVNWADPKYDDVGMDDHITNPTIDFITAGLTFDILSFGFGGASILQQKTFYNSNATIYDVGITIPGLAETWVTVDGVVATVSVAGTQVTVLSPSPLNSTVSVTIFATPAYSKVRRESFPSAGVDILTYPPGTFPLPYLSTFVFDAAGQRLNAPYLKLYKVSDLTTVFPSSVPAGFAGTWEVYTSDTSGTAFNLRTLGPDYTVTGLNEIDFGVPFSAGTVIAIFGFQDEDFTITGVMNETLTLTSAQAVQVFTWNEDTSLGLRTECYAGTSTGVYNISQPPRISGDLYVWLDGVKQEFNRDFILNGLNIEFNGQPNHTGSTIQASYIIYDTSLLPVGFRYLQTSKNEISYLRISDQHTTILAADFNIGDSFIEVQDATVLGQPWLSQQRNERIPGRVFIGHECIEFWEIDYSTTPQRLNKISRGTNGTAIEIVHTIGDKIVDASDKQLMVKRRFVNSEDSKIFNHNIRESYNAYYEIPGRLREYKDLRVWTREIIELVNDLNVTDTTITVTDSSALVQPGPTILANSPLEWSGNILNGDKLTISVNGTTTATITFGVVAALQDVADAINVSGTLSAEGLTAEVQVIQFPIADEILVLKLATGGQLVVQNNLGCPLQEIYGGQMWGSVTSPTVIVDAIEGIKINGVTIIWTGAGDLASIIADINLVSTSSKVFARSKGGRLQLYNLEGAGITVEDVGPSEDSLIQIGLSAVANGSSEIIYTTVAYASGTPPIDFGKIWINDEYIQFQSISFISPTVHVLNNIVRDVSTFAPDYVVPAGTKILPTKFVEQEISTDFVVFKNKVKMNSQLPIGSILRIQNKPITSKLIIKDNIQSDDEYINKFLRRRPARAPDL